MARAVLCVTGKCDWAHVKELGCARRTAGGGCPHIYSGGSTTLVADYRAVMTSAQLHLHRDGEAADAFADLVRLTVGEVQSHVATAFVAVVSVETIAGNKGHIFRQGCAE